MSLVNTCDTSCNYVEQEVHNFVQKISSELTKFKNDCETKVSYKWRK